MKFHEDIERGKKRWNGGKIGVRGSRRPLQSRELFVRGICIGFDLKNSVNDQNIFSLHLHPISFPRKSPPNQTETDYEGLLPQS